jgi:MraZ protein
MLFLGNQEAKTDAKGRIFLPSVFRKQLTAASEEYLVLRKDSHQDCLTLYPQSVWDDLMCQLNSRLNRWDPTHRMVLRQWVSDVEIITLDGNGRFLIPRRYLEMAHIHQDVRFIGMDDTIEIWAKELTERPFMGAEEFGKALQEIMSDNHLNNETK